MGETTLAWVVAIFLGTLFTIAIYFMTVGSEPKHR
jgi:hypothetical protein